MSDDGRVSRLTDPPDESAPEGVHVRRTLAVLVVLVVTALSLTACSSSDSSNGGGSSSGGTTVDITIKNGTVSPKGDRLKVKAGDPVTLKIDSDRAGEIHVHSTPEQHIDFPKGSSTKKLTIDTPGIVDVEDHALDVVIVQLQVS
jgi:plastocyanin